MRKAHVVIALGLLTGLLPAAAPARAAATPDVVVQAGAIDPGNEVAPYEYTAYYPRREDLSSTIAIHPGGVVQWNFAGFHSVTFLPGDTGEGDNAAHPFWTRADEVPGVMAPNEPWWVGSGCGKGDQDPCVVRGNDEFISSGAPLFDKRPFQARFDLPAGTTIRYHCTVHPSMHGHVRVVSESTPLPSQADIDAQIGREVAEDTAKADALVHREAPSRFDGDARVWTVQVGAQSADRTVQVIAYIGDNADGSSPLRIGAGDTVEFVMSGQEPHTVTFPQETIGSLGPPPYGTGGLRGTPRCELDDPSTGLPGIPFPPAAVQGCRVGQLEITFSPWMTEPHTLPDKAVRTPVSYIDSGLMVSADHAAFMRTRPTNPVTFWPSSLTATFPVAGTFNYGCNLHTGLMIGSLQVT